MTQPTDALLQTSAGNQWEKIGTSQHHGINVPLFSLHSAHSCGIGEYTDLIPLIDWCKSIGFDTIQTLPLNDTGPQTSPYSAISAYALNPIYLGLEHLPNIPHYQDLQKNIFELKQLSNLPRIDYKKVLAGKEDFLRQYFQRESSNITSLPEYKKFLDEMHWLKGYALFKTLKMKNNWLSWQLWPTELNSPTTKVFDGLCKQFADDINFHSFVQFLCFRQMEEIKKYATSRQIFIKGDIPILISRESADVWLDRQIFNLTLSAGAPPDMYSSEGQNWEFPIYNWDELEKQNFKWWRDRLIVAERFYHIYRLDHVVGFFRIWAIPPGHTGKDGKYIPSDESQWIPQGKKILSMMLQTSSMLPIGEDLGMVSKEVRACLKELGICGTKVLRWERFWDQHPEQPYIPFDQYIPESMTTVSTHDSDTLDLWWHNNKNEAEEFAKCNGWYYVDRLSREHLQDILWDSHHTASIYHINLLQEYLALVPGMVWTDPQQERINVPGIISDNNWTYRFRPSLEEITANSTLRAIMQELVK